MLFSPAQRQPLIDRRAGLHVATQIANQFQLSRQESDDYLLLDVFDGLPGGRDHQLGQDAIVPRPATPPCRMPVKRVAMLIGLLAAVCMCWVAGVNLAMCWYSASHSVCLEHRHVGALVANLAKDQPPQVTNLPSQRQAADLANSQLQQLPCEPCAYSAARRQLLVDEPAGCCTSPEDAKVTAFLALPRGVNSIRPLSANGDVALVGDWSAEMFEQVRIDCEVSGTLIQVCLSVWQPQNVSVHSLQQVPSKPMLAKHACQVLRTRYFTPKDTPDPLLSF